MLIDQNFGECPIFNPTFIGFVIFQFSMFSFFLCFSLLSINRQNSFESGILRQDYGIIQGFVDKPSMTPVSSIKTTVANVSFDGWMDDLRFYVLFNSVSVISG